MNREEFLARLKNLLSGVPEEERNEAIQYYIDYFEDAGPENEAKVIEELGTPEKLAAMIKADLKGGSEESGEFTEHGYTDERFEQKESPACREKAKHDGNRYSYHDTGKENRYSYQGTSYQSTHSTGSSSTYQTSGYEGAAESPRSNNWLKLLLIILIAIVACPIVIPILAAAVVIVLGLICAAFGILIGLVIAALAIAVAGFLVIIAGFVRLLTIPPSALLTIGIGILMFTFGMIATAASVKLCIVLIPALCRFLVDICRRPFHRKAVV